MYAGRSSLVGDNSIPKVSAVIVIGLGNGLVLKMQQYTHYCSTYTTVKPLV